MDVRGPDGKIIRFPEGTPPEKINEVMSSIYTKPPEEKGIGSQLWDATKNTVAGLVEGAASIPDAAVHALGSTMGQGVRNLEQPIEDFAAMLGADGKKVRETTRKVASAFENPVTVGGAAQKLVPTPNDASGKVARVASQFAGGAVVPIPKLMGLKDPPVHYLSGQTLTKGQEVKQAADRLGQLAGNKVDVLPADVGGPVTRMSSAAVSRTPLGAMSMAPAAEKSVESIGQAADDVASLAGQATTREGAGQIVKKGAEGYISKTAQRGGLLYDKAADLAGDTTIQAKSAVDMIDTRLTQLAKAPNSNKSAIAFLQGLKNDFVDEAGNLKPLDIQTVRDIRTAMRTEIGNLGLRSSPTEFFANKVLQEAGNDISDGLVAAGRPDAAKAYSVADKFWKGRVETIDDVLAPIVGKGGDAAPGSSFDAIMRMGKGDNQKVAKLMSSLNREEAGAIRATTIQQIGLENAGASANTTREFSPVTFLTNWKNLSPEFKATMFGGDPKLRKALEDLATVAGGTKAAQKYANFSNSGTMLGTLATGATLTHALSPATWALWGMNYGAGKLLSSQAYVNWLTRLAKSPATEGAMSARVAELGAVAARMPMLKNDVLAVQESMLKAMNDNVAKVAASTSEEKQQAQGR